MIKLSFFLADKLKKIQIRYSLNTLICKKRTIMHFTNSPYPDNMKHDTMVTITMRNKTINPLHCTGAMRLVP